MTLIVGSVVFLILIFSPFIFWRRDLLKRFKEMSLRAQIILVIIFTWQIIQLGIQFPGMISIDDILLWDWLLKNNAPSTHQSLSYSFVTYGWAALLGKPYYLSLLNLVYFTFVLFLVFRVLPESISKWTLLGLIILFSMPQTSALVFFQNRDSLFSILTLWLFIGFLAPASKSKQDIWFNPWVLIVLSLILGDLRQEGRFFLILTPFALWWGQSKSFSYLVKSTLILFSSALILYVLPAKLLDLDTYSSAYRSTLFINPLSYVFHTRGAEAASQEEVQKIEKMVLVSDLIKEHTPLDIGPFHRGKVAFLSEEEAVVVEQTVANVLIKNWDLVIQNRIQIALNMLNFKGAPYMFSSDFPYPSTLARQHLAAMHNIAYGMLRSFHYTLSSFLIPLLTLFFGLFYFKSRPEVFSASVTNLFRLTVVLVAAPAAYFKYVSSSWIFGWFLFFYLLELSRPANNTRV